MLKSRLDYYLKHNFIFYLIFKNLASALIRVAGIFILTDEEFILFSGHGRRYNDSPRKIYEYLINHPDYREKKFIWALESPSTENIPGKCKKIKVDTISYFLMALKCKYWITSVNIERGLKFKKKKTIYLNTWHGIPLKKVGNDLSHRKDFDFSHITFFCSSSEYESDIYSRCFKINQKNIIKTGLPRNDELYSVSDCEIKTIKIKLNIPLNKKIILYAPTWRDSLNKGESYDLAPPIDINRWKRDLKEEFIVLFRTHPYTNKLLNVKFGNFLRDFSEYGNINDLLKISDILISDYSAIIFDYAILERYIICFAYDYEEYCEKRGLYLNLNDIMPGGVAFNENDVINRILNYKKLKSKVEIIEFKKRFLKYGGNATEECINYLFSK